MTLHDLISCETLINDDTRLGLILWDPAQCAATAQAYGRWFEDHILKYMEWTVEHFTYWAASNRLVIRISQEGAENGSNF